MNILLITSSIIPIANDVKLLDIDTRFNQTLVAIEAIKRLDLFDKIYLCDASGFDMKKIDDLIFLNFKHPQDIVRKYGKSMGELLIYEHFFANSNLEDESIIYKISGRWIIENMDIILNKTMVNKNLFYTFYPYGLFRDYVQTSFFKSEIGRLKEIVNNSKEIILNDPNIVLETAFYISLLKYKKRWTKSSYPLYNCIGGTSNKSQKKPYFEFKFINLFTRLGMFAFEVE